MSPRSSTFLGIFSLVLYLNSLVQLSNGEEPLKLNYTIDEELPPGTLVGNIKEDAANVVSKFTASSLHFELSTSSSSSAHLFTLDRNVGNLATRAQIDREKLCESNDEHCDVIQLIVRVLAYRQLDIITVNVCFHKTFRACNQAIRT
jgi:hypothetical protein